MKIKDLKDFVNGLPDDNDLVISEPFVIDEKDEITAIVDLPVVGMAYNEAGKELRFVLRYEDTKGVFPPEQVRQFDFEKNSKI